jgi:uncharacterized protein (DUF1697 family)
MKYVAFLRGINVGGNTMIAMSELKKAFETSGFTNVATYINSGNIMFESDNENIKAITEILEKDLTQTFHYTAVLVIKSHEQLQEVLSDVPNEWKTQKDIRCYIAFIKEPISAEAVLKEVRLKEGVDSAKPGKSVVYMTTLLSGLTTSGFSKLAGTKIYKDITIRNYNTAKKLLTLMNNPLPNS